MLVDILTTNDVSSIVIIQSRDEYSASIRLKKNNTETVVTIKGKTVIDALDEIKNVLING